MPDVAIAAPPAATPAPSSPPSSTTSPAIDSPPSSGATSVEAPESSPSGAPEVPKAPVSSDYPETADGVDEFVKAKLAWDREHPDEAPPEAPPEAATEPEAQPEEQPQPDLEDEPAALTPEAISALEAETPELKALFDSKPALKGQFYKMARENARLAPMGELFPTVASAQFARETADSTVAIKAGFLQAAEDPSKINDAFERFTQEFAIVDKEGNPVRDAAGNPTYGPDLEIMVNHVVDNYHAGEISEVQERLNAGKYGSEQAKERDEALLEAYNFIKAYKDADPADFDRPDTSEMTPEQKDWFDRRDAELKRREEEQGIRKKTEESGQKAQARQAHERKVGTTVGESMGKKIDEMLAADLANNVNIPKFALSVTDPADGKSYFAKSIAEAFRMATVGRFDKQAKKYVGGDPQIRMDVALLESLPPGEDSARQRVEYFNQLINDHLPRIYDAEKKKLQKMDREDRKVREAKDAKARAGITPEPVGGSAPQPAGKLDYKSAYAKAEAAIRAKDPSISLSDLDEQAMREAWKLMR